MAVKTERRGERKKVKLVFAETRIDWKFSNTRREPHGELEVREYMRCAVNPIYFIHNYCYLQDPVQGRIPFMLYPFQVVTLKMFLLNRFNIVLKPRQMGLSWLVAAFALWLAMFRPNQNVVIISIKEDVAKRFMDKIKYMYRHMPNWLKGEIETENTSLMSFTNQSRVNSVPTSEDAGRSEALSLLIVDEAAFVRWIDKIWAASFSTLSTGGMGILISTANGLGNFFANKWRDSTSGESEFNAIQLHWRMHPERDDEWYRMQRRELGPALCAQEVDCDFLNSGRPVFDSAILVEWSEYLRKHKPYKTLYTAEENELEGGLYDNRAQGLYLFEKPAEGRHYLVGIDPATGDGKDYAGIQVVDWESGRHCAEMRILCKPDELANYAVAIGKMYNWGMLIPERNGMGLALITELVKKGYPNIYTYVKDDPKMDPEAETLKMLNEETTVIGWTTTKTNRPVLISTGEQMVREYYDLQAEGIVSVPIIMGMRTLNEMLVFNWQDTGMPNPRANEGYNDDLVIAWFLCQHVRLQWRPARDLPVLFA